MESEPSNLVLEKILEDIDIPESAYQKAEKRYQNIADWLHRPESRCTEYSPHVFSQGSFRLGTAIKPLVNEHYDLDMGCTLRTGISKSTTSQQQLKILIGGELQRYRKAKQIMEELEEKRRCWRLEYSDDLNFHIDVVPAIPEENEFKRAEIKSLMVESSAIDEVLAQEVADLTLSITDNKDKKYTELTPYWRVSNPEGYAKWFESRMRLAREHIQERAIFLAKRIDDVPYYQWKTPLQQAIQLLKRHRDEMYGDDEGKPISIIITTLAARAYQGERTLSEAVRLIVNNMESYIKPAAPYVPNPVNPKEDFADKWDSAEYADLNLREKFKAWIAQAKADLNLILSGHDNDLIFEAAKNGFNVNIDRSLLGKTMASPVVSPNIINQSSPRPWRDYNS